MQLENYCIWELQFFNPYKLSNIQNKVKIKQNHWEIKQFSYWIYYKVLINYKWRDNPPLSIEINFILVVGMQEQESELLQVQTNMEEVMDIVDQVLVTIILHPLMVEVKFINHIHQYKMVQVVKEHLLALIIHHIIHLQFLPQEVVLRHIISQITTI